MSDPDGFISTNTVSHEGDSQCEYDACTASTPPTPKPKPKKKRYIPPQPDSNTFPTQQAFLDSLTPISIEKVDQMNRKCPICWKPFGEAPDAGFDNTEQPVQLRCAHVFGDKCLATTYGIPETLTIEIRPFSYLPQSRAHALSQKLDAYTTQHKKPLENHAKIFEEMLEESYQPGKGREIFGDYWWLVLQELRDDIRHTKDVIFLEDAVIVELEETKPRQNNSLPCYSSIQPGALTPVSTNMNQTLSEATAELSSSSSSSEPFGGLMSTTIPLQWSLSHGDTITIPAVPPPPPGYPQFYTPLPPIASAPKPMPNSTGDLKETASFISPAPPTIFEHYLGASEASVSWEAALVGETQLDKLAALQKQAKQSLDDSSTTHKVQALADQVTIDAARARQNRRQERLERKKRERKALLARKLAVIYASFQASTSSTNLDKFETPSKPSHLVHASMVVHTKDLLGTSYEINPPGLVYVLVGNELEEHELELDTQTLVPIIVRSICNECCEISEEAAREVSIPESLWWRNDVNTPDDCPLCHKILFKKGRKLPHFLEGVAWEANVPNE
ncbi:hypothetical protein BKA66DRAFT_564777 [Pyrenochaeta sp. MPI-SDFR-AT-0127]|nr:hypothetical protein BKA66DRAFT_564777 [Pyrenochaeta sp. MPI-SDFR-AT-0127]